MKTKLSKKIFSIFLALLMAVTVIPFAAVEANAAENFELLWPCDSYLVSTMYYYSSGNEHKCRRVSYPDGDRMIKNGMDIAGDTDDAIYAAEDGVVISAGWKDGGWGNQVEIEHDNGYTTYYAHMSSVSVKEGDKVTEGQQIGYMGNTTTPGVEMGVHLHFEYSGANPWTEYYRDFYYSNVKFTSNVYTANNNKKDSDSDSKELIEFIDAHYTKKNGIYEFTDEDYMSDEIKFRVAVFKLFLPIIMAFFKTFFGNFPFF